MCSFIRVSLGREATVTQLLLASELLLIIYSLLNIYLPFTEKCLGRRGKVPSAGLQGHGAAGVLGLLLFPMEGWIFNSGMIQSAVLRMGRKNHRSSLRTGALPHVVRALGWDDTRTGTARPSPNQKLPAAPRFDPTAAPLQRLRRQGREIAAL